MLPSVSETFVKDTKKKVKLILKKKNIFTQVSREFFPCNISRKFYNFNFKIQNPIKIKPHKIKSDYIIFFKTSHPN